MDVGDLDKLVACPQCDTLHVEADLPPGARAHCQRCGTVLKTSRPAAVARILSLATASVILMIAAISFPFLDLDAQGLHRATSVIDAVLAFNDGLALPLAVAVAFFIIVLPLTRLLALAYALWPLAVGSTPRAPARGAFALAEYLRPWAMAEIFMVGVAVALVKVVGLATVTFGPAFWALAVAVVLTAAKDQLMCRYSIWEALERR